MKHYTKRRHRIIDWIGLRGAMPVLRADAGAPAVLRPGDDESGLRRVGWPEFFAAAEGRDLVFVYDEDRERLDYQFVPREVARRELGPDGTSWARRVVEVVRQLPVVQH